VAPRTNSLGQPIGDPLPGWTPRPHPPRTPLVGRLCRLEPLDAAKHAADLHAAHAADAEDRNWTYLPYGPFASAAEYRAWLAGKETLSYSPALQRTAAATEAMYLMMRRAFEELGYRRYEWKCDSLNAPSLGAAKRLGFRYEGIFRQAVVLKGRNRDNAWLSIVDGEWPAVRAALEGWLAPANFDAVGAQRRSLGELMREARGEP